MHRPRPYGEFGAENEADAVAANALVRQLTNLKEASGVPSLRMVRTLPSGVLAIAQDMGGIVKVLIQPGQAEAVGTTPTPDGIAVPMMFSGAIDSGRVLRGGGVTVRLSATTKRRLAGYDAELAAKVPDSVVLQRFVVELGQRFFEFKPKNESGWVVTQYEQVRPSWFSGAMADVVQIVGGYGRQDFGQLPANSIERAYMALPAEVAAKIQKELGQFQLPGYTGQPPMDGQFRFDYKNNATNLVGFDGEKNPWLLRVGPDGVYAMPLPMIPATTTAAFRIYVEEKDDDELRWALGRFGGLPSGEGFPTSAAEFQAWRRAGVISRVCDVADFYSHYMYSTAMGWTMNAKGTEGFNTCYDQEADGSNCFSFGYKLRLALGAAPGRGVVPARTGLTAEESNLITQYVELLARSAQGRAGMPAIFYKLASAPARDVILRAKLTSEWTAKSELDYWDSREMSPIAAHGGSVTQTAKGPIGWSLAGFKFPEPVMGGCVSFQAPVRPSSSASKADTILAGYYVGDQLKVIKYFTDARTHTLAVDAPDECMTVGSWDSTVTESTTGLMGNYYTTDFDDRQAIADITTKTHIVGTDLGYDHLPNFSYDNWFWRPGTLWRNRYFQHRTKQVRTEGSLRTVAVCMPYLDRNAVLHARTDSHTGKQHTESVEVHYIQDPWTYRYWTDDFIWAWIGGVSGPQAKVPVYPKDGNPVWVVQQNYSPGPCSDFADSGPWIPGLPADYTWLIHPNRHEWMFSGPKEPTAPKVNTFYNTWADPAGSEGRLDMSTLSETFKVHNDPSAMYFLKSPDEFVGVFYRDAVKVAAGECEYANVSEADPNNPKLRAHQGWSRMANHKAAHHFIGVINE